MKKLRIALVVAVVFYLGAGGLERAWAVSNPNGIVFRAVGLFQGEVEEGKCKVPNAGSGIADYTGAVCRDAVEIVDSDGDVLSRIPTRMYPEFNPGFVNFCGGFLALQNNMINQGLNVFKIKIRYKIPGRGFPVLCRGRRKSRLFVGGRIDPVNSTNPNPFGVANMSFTQLLPIYSQELLHCLRDPARGNVAAPVTIRASIRALAYLDGGGRIKSNRVRYSLTLVPAGSDPGLAGLPPRGYSSRCVDIPVTPVP